MTQAGIVDAPHFLSDELHRAMSTRSRVRRISGTWSAVRNTKTLRAIGVTLRWLIVPLQNTKIASSSCQSNMARNHIMRWQENFHADRGSRSNSPEIIMKQSGLFPDRYQLARSYLFCTTAIRRSRGELRSSPMSLLSSNAHDLLRCGLHCSRAWQGIRCRWCECG